MLPPVLIYRDTLSSLAMPQRVVPGAGVTIFFRFVFFFRANPFCPDETVRAYPEFWCFSSRAAEARIRAEHSYDNERNSAEMQNKGKRQIY